MICEPGQMVVRSAKNSRFASLLCPRAPRARNAAALIETCTCTNELWELAFFYQVRDSLGFFSLELFPSIFFLEYPKCYITILQLFKTLDLRLFETVELTSKAELWELEDLYFVDYDKL